MKKLIVRIGVNAAALWVAASLVSGIELSSSVVSILAVAIIFGLVNAVLKPVVSLFALPFTLVTLGLFTLVINAAMLMVTDYLSQALRVDGFGAAIFGAVVVSVVSWALSTFLSNN